MTNVFAIGERVAGDYEIRAVLGSGGMGQVFDAHDHALNRRVAIKAHWPHLTAFSIRNEARALAAIRHPAVVAVHTIARHTSAAGEIDLMVMECIVGVSLDRFLARRRIREPLTIAEALELLQRLAEALAAVHAAGIAHRDVKPSNIMLAPRNRLVLTDFGIFVPEIDIGDLVARTGTAEYMAPEVISGTVVRGGGYLADVYAFGVLGFELLCGRLPFLSSTVQEMLQLHVGEPAPPVRSVRRDVPTKLAEIIDGALRKEPMERPSTMETICGMLRSVTADAVMRPIEILVAEDDPELADALRRFVSEIAPDAIVRIAGDGAAVLAYIRQTQPDLLLLDLGLPSMNGVELCMYLRGAGIATDMSIVALSASAHESDRGLLRQLGIGTFIRKGGSWLARVEETVRSARESAPPRSSARIAIAPVSSRAAT